MLAMRNVCGGNAPLPGSGRHRARGPARAAVARPDVDASARRRACGPGLVFVLLVVVVVKVRGSREHLQRVFEQDIPLIRPLANQVGWNPDNSKIIHHIGQAFSLSSTTLLWVAVGLAAYASIEFIEAIGLWLMKRWGEYFAVIATSIFLPLEIYELIEKVTVLRVLALLVNIVAVVWLLWSKRLFGLNGGGKAYEQEHRAESLLSVERAALGENLEAA